MCGAFEGAVINVGEEQDLGCVNSSLRDDGEAFGDGIVKDQTEEKCGEALSLEEAVGDVEDGGGALSCGYVQVGMR